MIDYAKAYISQAIYLTGCKPDPKIRYKQEQAEDAFSSFMSTQAQSTNLPDDFDPAQPRLIFQTPTKQLILSQVACQLSLGFENAHKSLEEQLDVVLKNTREIHKRIAKFKPSETLNENALILALTIPSSGSRENLSDILYDKLVKLPKLAGIASTSLKVGYQLPNNLFLNIEADVYEKRGGHVTGGQIIDVMTLPVVEQGVTLKLDVNSRPKALLPGYVNDGPEEIISTVQEYFPQHLLNLLQS